ncbi:hypothetical protein NR458_01370 [Pediococcus ethanolidurans]|uniref:mucin-binding protein n=1 Tax=Pediococcus ethanolidurans TaxID=319653 RepID=UPI0021AB04D6|nr:hypothetical protein [Pediococcus ethanolidurans]MCT4397123.1 hypothetical protein [Pediococcus ethanolidurans]MCV3322950.1 hypothetical protein [Pediococcus ethanolidurans]MCV3554441.1 hypothetical protein [Pediococcus ethanolidurans]
MDPQDAGNNVNKTADVGIDGLTDTTFIGRDFYPDSSKGDTVWGSLTIRQTDASGNIITTPAANITVGTGQTNVIKTGEYYTLTWVPTSADTTTGRVTGTLNYTTYTDSTKSTVLQTTGAVTVTLSDAVSLAAFGATGGTSSVQTAVISSFTGTRVTMPVTVHYVGQKSNALSPDDTIIVNVGSIFGVGAETDTDNNTNTSGTYAAKPIDGYTYGASSAEVTVVNTNITAGATNEITITYLANTGTQTVNYDQTGLPNGTTGDFSIQTQTATEASTEDATKDAARGYAVVAVTQVAGYTSYVSVNGAVPVAMKSIPAEDAGATDENDIVTYTPASDTTATISYVDDEDGGQVVGTQTVSGATDATVSYTVANPDSSKYNLVDVTDGDSGSIKLTADNTDNVTIHVTHVKSEAVVPTDPKDPNYDSTHKTITETINYVWSNPTDHAAGNEPSKAVTDSISYTRTASVDAANGDVTYGDWTAVNDDDTIDAVKSPTIAGYTSDKADVAAVTVSAATVGDTTVTTIPVTVTYTPASNLVYSEITVTRTVHYEGAGSQTPQNVVEKVVYKTVTNKTTGEVSYTPQGVYDAVETPTLFGYTNSGDVAKLIPMATTNAPKDSLVVVQYKKTTDENGNSTNSGNPSNPGDSGSNHNSSDLGNSGITHGTDSNSDTGNSNASGNETVQNHVKNSTDSKVKLETLQNSNVKGKSKKMLHRIKL